jgi:MFS family permease
MSHPNVVESNPTRKLLLSPNFIALLVTQTCFGLAFSCFFLLPKYLKLWLGASDVEIGAVGAVGSLAGVFAFPLVGALNDRLGRKPFVLLGCLLMVLASAAMLSVDSVGPALYVLRALHGLAFALVFNSATTLISDEVPAAKLGHALALFGAAMLATHAVAPALAELLAARAGWGSVFWSASALAALSAVAALAIEDVAHAPRAPAGLGVLPLLRQARTRRIILTIAAAGAGFGTVFTFHQPYALSLGMTQLSGFFVAYACSALLSRLWLTARLSRFTRTRISAVAIFCYGAAVLGTAWLRPGVLEAVGAVMGLAQGVFYPLFNALAIDGVQPSQRGSMMALYHGGFNAGIAAALLVGGGVAERFGYSTLFALSAAVTMAAALALARNELEPRLNQAREHAATGDASASVPGTPDSTRPSRHHAA